MLDKNIGKLRVVLGLDDRQFRQGLQGTAPRLRALGRAMAVTVAGGALAAGAAMATLTQRSMALLDAQAKLAQSLDTTVASVQVLTRAGQLAGVSMSGIEQAAGDMTRRLSQAAASGGPVADALDRLGLSAATLLDLPLDERVAAVNDALERFIPAAERAAVAGQLFGEEGALTMTRIDTATLEQATDELERFGVIVSEVEADQIEAANDALSRMGLVAEGLGNRMAARLAPALQNVAGWMTDMVDRRSDVEIAIDNNTIAIGDEIDQINQLLLLRPGENRMSVEAAMQALREAQARRESVRAMQEQAREMALTQAGYASLLAEIDEAIALRDARFGAATDADQVPAQMREAYEAAEAVIVRLLQRQQEMIALGEDAAGAARSENEAALTELDALIAQWQEAIDNARDGVVVLNGEVVTGIDLSERLAREAESVSFNNAISGASELAERLGVSLSLARQIAAVAGTSDVGNEIFDPRSPRYNAAAAAAASAAAAEALRQAQLQEIRDSFNTPLDSGGGGGGGATRAMTDDQREAQRVIEATRTEVERLNLEQERLNRLYRLGAIDGETYRRAMEDLNQDMAAAQYPLVVQGIDSVSEAMARTIVMGENLRDQFAQILQRMAFDILNSGINSALMQMFNIGGGGGGNLLSGLVGGLVGGGGLPSFAGGGFTGWDARSGGLDGQGGRLAMIHPQEIITDLARGGTVPSSGGRSEVLVRLAVPEGVTVEDSRRIAGDVAVTVVREYDRSLPDRVSQIQRDPRVRG